MKKAISFFLAVTIIATFFITVNAETTGTMDNFKKLNKYTEGMFTDIQPNVWYENSVKSAYEFGLMKGSSTDTFSPLGNITIAETLALACRVNNIYNGNTKTFEQGNPWYQVYVDYAMENDIITSEYDYNSYATRADFATILFNSLPSETFTKINNIEDGAIPDIDSKDDCYEIIYALYNAGIMTGSDKNGTFAPNSNITRSEVSAIITRIADRGERKQFELELQNSDSEIIYDEEDVISSSNGLNEEEKENVLNIINFIDKYGYTTEEGYKQIARDSSMNSVKIQSIVEDRSKDGYLTFYSRFELNKMYIQVALDYIIDCPDEHLVTVAGVTKFAPPSYFIKSANIDISNYTSPDELVFEEWSDLEEWDSRGWSSDSLPDEYLVSMSRDAINCAMPSWDMLLVKRMNTSLKDIGFKAYNGL